MVFRPAWAAKSCATRGVAWVVEGLVKEPEPRNRMREIFTSGTVGRAPGNRCLYPELETDQSLDENPCDECGACKDACPAEAIKEDGTLDYRACASQMMGSGLPGIINSIRKMVGADENTVKGVVYNPAFWDMWQSAVSGIFYSCSECMASCPVGSD